MKFFIVALCFIASAVAAPTRADALIAARRALPAVDHEEIHDEYGQYAFRYMTAEGTIVSERGHLVPNPSGPGYVMVVEGQYSFIGSDGKEYVTKYTAGLDGTHVEGNHLPEPVTPEPVEPVEIPSEIVAEPEKVVAEPVQVVARPTEVVVKPVDVMAAAIPVVAEHDKEVAEPVKMVSESFQVGAEPVKIVAEFFVEPAH